MRADIIMVWWYCLDCGFAAPLEAAVKQHWSASHGEGVEKAMNGVDCALGSQLLTMQDRRKEWIAAQADHFRHAMHDGFGPEDFLAEAEIHDADA